MVFITPIYLTIISDFTKTESIGVFVISLTISILFMFLYAFPVSLLAEYISLKLRFRMLVSFLIHVAFSVAYFTYLKRASGEIELLNPGNLIAVFYWGLDELFRYIKLKKENKLSVE